MAGLPLYVSGGNAAGGNTRISFFLKLNTLLSHQTALVDIDGGSTGFLRVSWDPTQYLMAEGACQGGSGFVNIWPPATSPPVNQWMWISAVLGADNNWGTFTIEAQVWTSTTSPGMQRGSFGSGYGGVVSCGLGWGVPLTSTYNPFPNALGDEMTELIIETAPGSVFGPNVRNPPTAPIDPVTDSNHANIVALYHCDVPLGANQAIKDDTGHGYDLAPGTANGDLILHDSPF